MAEIKIEKKKPVWPWVLLGLIIIGIIVYLLVYDDYNEEVDDIDPTEETEAATLYKKTFQLGMI